MLESFGANCKLQFTKLLFIELTMLGITICAEILDLHDDDFITRLQNAIFVPPVHGTLLLLI